MNVPKNLRKIVDILNEALKQLQEELPQGSSLSDDLLPLLHNRVEYVNDTVALTLENYDLVHNDKRPKRGLINVIGQLSRALFGTAMQEDVEKLRRRYNQLTYVASNNNKVIHLNSRNIVKLNQHIKNIEKHAELLRTQLNKAFTNIRNIHHYAVIGEALSALENAAASLLHTNERIVSNIVDAARGRVTSSLFPVKDFRRALEIGSKEYDLTPLIDVNGIHHYYPLLESVLTSQSIVIHVPFKSRHSFEVHRVESFPFKVL